MTEAELLAAVQSDSRLGDIDRSGDPGGKKETDSQEQGALEGNLSKHARPDIGDREPAEKIQSSSVISSQAAIEELLRREYSWVLRMCVAEIRDRELAIDCVQESLIQIAKALPRFHGRSELRTWMFTIVRRTAIRFRKRDRNLQERFPLGVEEDVASERGVSADVLAGKSLEERMLESEAQRNLFRMIRELPEKQRFAVLFHYFEDLSVEEAAKRLGCSAGTLKTHLFRGRERLKQLMSKSGNEAQR